MRDVSDVFDHFWQGDWAVPIAALVERPYTEEDLRAWLDQLREQIATGDYPYSIDEDAEARLAEVKASEYHVVWAPGGVVWDNPSSLKETGETGEMIESLRRKVDSLEKSFTLESAYFVIGERGLANAKKLVWRIYGGSTYKGNGF